MTRFFQQQIQPMTERSVPQAPCPSCPSQVLNRKNIEFKPEKRRKVTKIKDKMQKEQRFALSLGKWQKTNKF